MLVGDYWFEELRCRRDRLMIGLDKDDTTILRRRSMRRQQRFLVLVASLAFLVPMGVSRLKFVRGADAPGREVQVPDGQTQAGAVQGSKTWTTAVEPKPLSRNVKKGLDWLVEHQLPSGGWGQGEESAQMRGNESLKDTPNVADTCIAVLALIRSGSTLREGLYRDAIVKGVRYVPSRSMNPTHNRSP
jgi:hypothetical protein